MSTYGTNLSQMKSGKAWDPLFGWQEVRAWRGTPAALAVKMEQLIAAGVRVDYQPNEGSGYDVLRAYFTNESQPVNQPLADVWTLVRNKLERSIWVHPKVVAIFADLIDDNGFPTSQFVAVRKDIEDLVSGEKDLDDIAWWEGANSNTKKFVRSLLKGVTAFPTSVWVLNNTKVIATNFNTQQSTELADKILSTAEMRTVYGVNEAQLRCTLPEGFWLEQTLKVEPLGTTGRATLTRDWIWAAEYDDFVHDRAF